MIQANELRIGNVILDDDGEMVVVEQLTSPLMKEVQEIEEEIVFTLLNDDTDFRYCSLKMCNGIHLTEEILLKFGAYQPPHLNVMNTFYFNLGRNRELYIGCVGTPNLMVFIQEIEKDENGKAIKVEDIICVHNWDYDGELYLHNLQNLVFSLTKKELNITI